MDIRLERVGFCLGHRLINARPDACCGEFDDGEEVGVALFISCGYRPVLFEF